MFFKVCVAVLALFPFVFLEGKVILNKEDPGKCDLSAAGNNSIVNDRDGNERVLICVKINGKYSWREIDIFPELSTLGEFFNPAEDCSDIVRKKRDAKSGLYWIKGFGLKKVTKVWCDLTTDGGGFMLIGYMNSPQSWTVPSDSSLVSPKGSPHWSSEFGNVSMLEFRIQISTTDSFANSKADWLYRFSISRRFNKLLTSDNGGCTNYYPGIGHIKYVKDLLLGKIVQRNFQCSRFGPASPPGLGWERMNSCLGKPCKEGYAVFPGTNFRYDNYGAFSYSTVSSRSGGSHNSTVFIGCGHGKCCACYGPKGASGDFCTPACQSINGGTVTTTSHTWFWVRSSVPKKPVWNKCTEFQVQTPDGRTEMHFIDKITGVSKKESCSKKELPNLVSGVVKVDNDKTLNSLPLVKGLLSYREDNTKLYLSNGQSWEALCKEKQNNDLAHKLSLEEKEILEIKKRLLLLEKELKDKIKKRLQLLEKELKDKVNNSRVEYLEQFHYYKSSSCKMLKDTSPSLSNGYYNIESSKVYCDMSSGWTLIARYSNSDSKIWISGHNMWYDRVSNYGATNNPGNNYDMISEGFWKTTGNEIKITRSDDSTHTALLQTTSNCLQGGTFRKKITSYGNFRNEAVWASDKCLGSCRVSYGGQYKSTAGFEQHSCSSDIQSSNYIGFWCDWSYDGAVLMIGGGGSGCYRADHGIGITEEDEAKFGGNMPNKYADFGYNPGGDNDITPPSSYSLNLWVR